MVQKLDKINKPKQGVSHREVWYKYMEGRTSVVLSCYYSHNKKHCLPLTCIISALVELLICFVGYLPNINSSAISQVC